MFDQIKSDLKHLKLSIKTIFKGLKRGNNLFVDKKTQLDRLHKCILCLNKTKRRYFFWKKSSCKLCGCFIEFKTKFQDEMCPDFPPKW